MPAHAYTIYKAGSLIKAIPAPGTNLKKVIKSDASTIQDAISSLTGRGGHVYIRAGEYSIPAKISVSEGGITIEGEGRGIQGAAAIPTKLKLADGVNDWLLDAQSGTLGFGLKNICIDGNKTGNTTVQDNNGGINLQGHHNLIENVHIVYTKGYGLKIYSWGHIVKDVAIEYCDYPSFRIESWLSTFIACHSFSQYTATRYAMELSSGAVQNMIYAGEFYNEVGGGVKIEGARNVLQACSFYNIKRHAILLSGAIRNCVVDNIIRGAGSEASNTYDAIILEVRSGTNCTRNVISRNIILSDLANKHRYGINESDANQDYNLIANNIITDSQTANIRKQGANSFVDHYIRTGLTHAVVGTLSVGTDKAPTLLALANMTILKVKLVAKTAPTGSDVICDINKNGTTIFTTQANRPKIVAGSTTGDSGVPDVASLVEGDKLTLDVDQVGSTVAGADLTAQIIALYNPPF
jgi:hypothetical protein